MVVVGGHISRCLVSVFIWGCLSHLNWPTLHILKRLKLIMVNLPDLNNKKKAANPEPVRVRIGGPKSREETSHDTRCERELLPQ